MVDIFTTFDRRSLSLPLNDEKVKSHIESTEKWKKKLIEARQSLPYSADDISKRFSDIEKRVDEEIQLCKFYLEYNERKRSCHYFKRWQLVKAADRTDYYGYEKIRNDAWMYTNGRMKAIVEVIKNTASFKVTLRLRNDSAVYQFYTKESDGNITDYKHFHKEDSANVYAEELKEKAINYLNEQKYLFYDEEEVNNTKTFLQFMHLTQKISDDEPLSETLEDECFHCLIQNRPDEKCPEYVKRAIGECEGKGKVKVIE
jgi:hypothetical protein